MQILNLELDKWQRMSNLIGTNNLSRNLHSNRQFIKLFYSRLIAENVFIFLVQYIGIMMNPLDSLVWIPSGTACGFVFLRGLSILPGIFFSHLFTAFMQTYQLKLACQTAVIIALQIFLLHMICYRYISPSLIFKKLTLFIQFIFISCILSGLASFALLIVNHTFLGCFWLSCWLGNLNAILTVAIALLTWDAYFPDIAKIHTLIKIRAALLYILLLILTIALISSTQPLTIILYVLATFVVIVIISVNLGWCGAIMAVSLFGILLNIFNFIATPIFTGALSKENLFFLQCFLSIETIVGLAIPLWVDYRTKLFQ